MIVSLALISTPCLWKKERQQRNIKRKGEGTKENERRVIVRDREREKERLR